MIDKKSASMPIFCLEVCVANFIRFYSVFAIRGEREKK